MPPPESPVARCATLGAERDLLPYPRLRPARL